MIVHVSWNVQANLVWSPVCIVLCSFTLDISEYLLRIAGFVLLTLASLTIALSLSLSRSTLAAAAFMSPHASWTCSIFDKSIVMLMLPHFANDVHLKSKF